MITQEQLNQLNIIRDAITSLDKQEKVSTQEFIKALNLPSWFDTATCVIVMNTAHKHHFKEYSVDWIAYSEYIMFGEMIVMDKTVPFTPVQTYY